MSTGKAGAVFGVIGCLVLIGLWTGWISEGTGGNEVPSATRPAVVPYYSAPRQMDFCGEAVPLNDPDTAERLDREFTLAVYNRAQVYLWLKRSERFLPWIEKQLALQGLPDDLKYVAVAESDLQVSVASPAGAVGMWQFMQGTACNYGLAKTAEVDERHDFEKAAAGAFRYFKDLRGMFGAWTPAVAAYNCGERRVMQEMKRQKVSNYYALKLPLETERYIFRIIAIKEILKHPQQYGYYLPREAGYPPVKAERVTVRLPQSVPLLDVAESAGMTWREFKVMNPQYISDTIPAGDQTVKVPEGKGRGLQEKTFTPEAKREGAALQHTVQKGETLSGICVKYGVAADVVRRCNDLQGDTVRLGQVLKIPGGE